MEFPFDINHLFSERIFVLDHHLAAGRTAVGRSDVQIATVIDELGRASAKAQQLTAPITSASKLQSNRHQLYLLKEGEHNGGRGVVVGFLKVGYKKLFLLDQRGAHVEAEPLCVLDFYVTETLQRHGYGLELFDFMLQHKRVEPVLMAYDRPSPKFLSFLAKHYCLTESVPQVNNFVVFDGFFLNRSAAQMRKVPPKKPDGEIKPYSLMERDVVRQEQRVPPWPFTAPLSPHRSASSPCSRSLSVGSSPSRAPPRPAPLPAPGGNTGQTPQSPLIDSCRARRTSEQGLVARRSLYSRHMDHKAVRLLDNQLPGVRAVGEQGYTDTHRVASNTPPRRSLPLSLPPLPASKKDIARSQTSVGTGEVDQDLDEARGVEEIRASGSSGGGAPVGQKASSEKESDRTGRGWSWTVGESRCTAQWVKQKQEYRSTRPW
ncbi:alpha-tubulin N-acetyltransferase 1 [Diretmus argenteus]